MITITFNPETAAQANVIARVMGDYLNVTDAAPAKDAPAETPQPKADTKPAKAETKAAKSESKPAKAAPAADPEGNDTPADTSTGSPTASSAPSQDSTVTLEQVRAKLASLSQAGKAAQVKGLISEFGVSKLTDVPAEMYGDLMAAAEAL